MTPKNIQNIQNIHCSDSPPPPKTKKKKKKPTTTTTIAINKNKKQTKKQQQQKKQKKTTTKIIEMQNLERHKNGPSLRIYENIRVPPPPPPLGLLYVSDQVRFFHSICELWNNFPRG